jgi:hypothetical protein
MRSLFSSGRALFSFVRRKHKQFLKVGCCLFTVFGIFVGAFLLSRPTFHQQFIDFKLIGLGVNNLFTSCCVCINGAE